jgi:hypothetical protein
MEIKNYNLVVLHVGGAAGSFLAGLLGLYIGRRALAIIDTDLGHAHDFIGVRRCHQVDSIDVNKEQVVLIDYDVDDMPTIARMAYHKSVKPALKKNPRLFDIAWRNMFGSYDQIDYDAFESYFVNNPQSVINKEFKEQATQIQPVLVVTFKDIFQGDLNQILAKFFQTQPRQDAEDLITQYRLLNQKYFA